MKTLFTALLLLPTLALANPSSDIRTISLTGYGEVEVKPDTAELNLSVMVTEEKALAAKKDIDERLDKFLSALRSKGVSKKDVVASNITTRPNWGYDHQEQRNYRERPPEPRKVIISYTATRNLTVTVRNLDKLGAVMEAALEQNIEGIDHVRYTSSKADEHRAKAQQLAIEHSKKQAQKLASAYGAELGEIHSINYHRGYESRGRVAEVQRASGLFRANGQSHGVYLPKQLIFSDSVNVVFKLK